MKRFVWITVILVIPFLFPVSCSNERVVEPLEVGSPAPAFTLECLDGEPLTESFLNGSPAALLFVNPGCASCREVVSMFGSLYGSELMEFLPRVAAVNVGPFREGKAFFRNHPLPFPCCPDGGDSPLWQSASGSLPALLLFNADGTYRERICCDGLTRSVLSDILILHAGTVTGGMYVISGGGGAGK